MLLSKKKLKKFKFSLNNEKITTILKKKIYFAFYAIIIKNNYFIDLFFVIIFLKHLNILSFNFSYFLTLIKKLFKINFDYKNLKKKC